jgi:hypothetical protein
VGGVDAALDLDQAAAVDEAAEVGADADRFHAEQVGDVGGGCLAELGDGLDDVGGAVPEPSGGAGGPCGGGRGGQAVAVEGPVVAVLEPHRVLALGDVAAGDADDPVVLEAGAGEDDDGVGGAGEAVGAGDAVDEVVGVGFAVVVVDQDGCAGVVVGELLEVAADPVVALVGGSPLRAGA